MNRIPILAFAAVLLSAIPAGAQSSLPPAWTVPSPNIAPGKPYTLKPEPNYPHCSRDPDRKLLTDGRFTEGFFWTQPTTVGWAEPAMVEITLDLGRIEPLAGAAFSTAAGGGGVNWPRLILVLTSDDGRTYRFAGELVGDSARFGLPKPGYGVHRYVSDRLCAKGRYVRFLVDPLPSYLFCDEIEVYSRTATSTRRGRTTGCWHSPAPMGLTRTIVSARSPIFGSWTSGSLDGPGHGSSSYPLRDRLGKDSPALPWTASGFSTV